MYHHMAPTTARPHLLCFRKKAHSGAHSWHIRAHSGTFWHIRAILEIPGCEPDLQKPTFSRSGGRRGGTFAARTPTFYNIKKGDGERRQPGSRILLRTRACVHAFSSPPPPCGRPTTAPFHTWRVGPSNIKQTFAPVCYRQVRKFLKIWNSCCPTSTGRWAGPLSGSPVHRSALRPARKTAGVPFSTL